MAGIGGKGFWKKTLSHTVLIATCFIMLYPVIWMFFSSFKPESEIFTSASLLPSTWLPENYREGWFGTPRYSFGTFLSNSFFISISVVIGNVLSASLVAFAFGRLRFRLQSFWFGVMLVTMMLPAQVILIPQYVLYNKLHWIDTYLPMIVPNFLGATPFFIFLIVQFVRGLPRELDESATIDGCNTFQLYSRIIMPLCVPALITTAIFSFIWTWDDFFSQLIYISTLSKYTVPLGLRLFLDATSGSQWGPMLAMATVSILPSFIVFLSAQKYFVEGIATTGMKN
ncbi:MAG: binding-protein-dependent transport system inner rane component [Paenibacillaceae bacterium]|jgi:multiple sugar transport system permease protein|nr:binding-protein-dependent transport system inner rane component [Paenibacillaceae bacterium]